MQEPMVKAAATAEPARDTDGYLSALCAITLPMGPPPEDLNEQRQWAEIRKLQLDTERSALELDILRRREVESAAEPARARVYTFYSSVDAESVRECMAELGQWSRRDPGSPITVVFNSPGGSVLDGLALFDYLRQLRAIGHHVTTVALGRAASMGAILLQAGDHRVVGENAFLLIHEVSHLSSGKVSELEDGVEFTRRLQRRLLAILASRSTLSEMQIGRRWARREWWLEADEAIGLGLADEVL
ncbi:MAG: ATP-dependent Clp protease, protease subunit [Acidimicrobiaceae bacterium]|nr:ATP-dependent Clp protease, protease subunit [Acidimicrobiaceae bacterium]